MAASQVEEFTRALTDPLTFAERLAARAADIRRDPAQLLGSLRDGLTDCDRRTVSDPAVGETLPRTCREALRESSDGRSRRPRPAQRLGLRPGGRQSARAVVARSPGHVLPVGHFT